MLFRRLAAAVAVAVLALLLTASGPAAATPVTQPATWTGAYGEWPPSDPIPHPDGTIAYRWYRITDSTIARLQDCVNANYRAVGRDRVVDWCIPRIPYTYSITVEIRPAR